MTMEINSTSTNEANADENDDDGNHVGTSTSSVKAAGIIGNENNTKNNNIDSVDQHDDDDDDTIMKTANVINDYSNSIDKQCYYDNDRILFEIDSNDENIIDNSEWIIEKRLIDDQGIATTTKTTTTTVTDNVLSNSSSSNNDSTNIIELTYTQSMEVDKTFERLFGYKWGTQFIISQNNNNNNTTYNNNNNNNNNNIDSNSIADIDIDENNVSLINLSNNNNNDNTAAQQSHQQSHSQSPPAPAVLSILCNMFGTNATAKLIYQQHYNNINNYNRKGEHQKQQRRKLRYQLTNKEGYYHHRSNSNYFNNSNNSNNINNNKKTTSIPFYQPTRNISNYTNTKSLPLSLVSNSVIRSNKTDVNTATTNNNNNNDNHSNNNRNTNVGVDVLLQQIADNDKLKISTIAKSSHDWDTFKNNNKELGTKLELHTTSTQSYLHKQEFLSRIDLKQFELEKHTRTIERSKRGI